jgi:transketolase
LASTTTKPTPDSQALAKKIRRHVLEMTSRGGSAHIGAAYSVADIIAVLYADVLNYDVTRPQWSARDRFILSKGHAGVAVYAALAEVGFIALSELSTYYGDGSRLAGHISHAGVPGVELSTGSLGHGLGVGAGMAKALLLAGNPARVLVVISDGECDEGSIWEAALFAQHHALSNLTVILDCNGLQSIGSVAETLALEPIRQKWESFNWAVAEVDGHNHASLKAAFVALPAARGKPTLVLARTVKGKGVSFMENSVLWHYRTARGAEYERARDELEAHP